MGAPRTWFLLGVGTSIAATLIGACSVDSFLMCGDACDDAGFESDAAVDASAESGADATNDGSTCQAKTCDSYPSDCHPSLDNGCGSTIDCSSACPAGQACIVDGGVGADAGFYCNGPPVCKDAGAPGGNCGTLTNPVTGQKTLCGNCTTAGDTCTSNTCSCGGIVCGAACCIGGQVCDTNINTCCTVTTTCGSSCNTTIPTNCGTSLPCGACGNGYNCGGGHICSCSNPVCGATCCARGSDVCFPSTTCCSPDSNSTTCSGACGNPVVNNCGQNVNCGACSDGEVCKATTCSCGTGVIVTCNQGQTCHVTGGSGNGSCS